LNLFRVYSGSLNADSTVYNAKKEVKERIAQIFLLEGKKQKPVGFASVGDIVAVAKLKETTTGDTLCDPDHPTLLEPIDFYKPVMSVAVEPRTNRDQEKLSESLEKLSEEVRVTVLGHVQRGGQRDPAARHPRGRGHGPAVAGSDELDGGVGVEGAENVFFVDGADASDFHYGIKGQNVVLEMLDEVKVTASGYNAEFGGSVRQFKSLHLCNRGERGGTEAAVVHVHDAPPAVKPLAICPAVPGAAAVVDIEDGKTPTQVFDTTRARGPSPCFRQIRVQNQKRGMVKET
jgi:hypothetical protein